MQPWMTCALIGLSSSEPRESYDESVTLKWSMYERSYLSRFLTNSIES